MEGVTKETVAELIRTTEIELNSTHTKLCLPIINRIFRKMSAGIKFSPIKVENDLICDGHHRYLASIFADFSLEIIPGSISSATTAVNWKLVSFDEEDWDTPAKILMLNKQDAEFNNMPLKKVVELMQ